MELLFDQSLAPCCQDYKGIIVSSPSFLFGPMAISLLSCQMPPDTTLPFPAWAVPPAPLVPLLSWLDCQLSLAGLRLSCSLVIPQGLLEHLAQNKLPLKFSGMLHTGTNPSLFFLASIAVSCFRNHRPLLSQMLNQMTNIWWIQCRVKHFKSFKTSLPTFYHCFKAPRVPEPAGRPHHRCRS